MAPTVGPQIAGNYGIYAKMPSDTQQAAISAYQAGTTSGAYGLRVEMASGTSAHGIYVKQGGRGDIIRDSGGNFRVLSTGAIDLAALTTAVSTIPWLRAQTAFAIPATVGTPSSKNLPATSGYIAVDDRGNLWFYSGVTRYKVQGTAA